MHSFQIFHIGEREKKFNHYGKWEKDTKKKKSTENIFLLDMSSKLTVHNFLLELLGISDFSLCNLQK